MEAVEFGGIVFCKERIHDIGNSGRPATIARKKTVPHFKEEKQASAFLVFPSMSFDIKNDIRDVGSTADFADFSVFLSAVVP